jgi:hypothetical protein
MPSPIASERKVFLSSSVGFMLQEYLRRQSNMQIVFLSGETNTGGLRYFRISSKKNYNRSTMHHLTTTR